MCLMGNIAAFRRNERHRREIHTSGEVIVENLAGHVHGRWEETQKVRAVSGGRTEANFVWYRR